VLPEKLPLLYGVLPIWVNKLQTRRFCPQLLKPTMKAYVEVGELLYLFLDLQHFMMTSGQLHISAALIQD
jgi:hypothetical protein